MTALLVTARLRVEGALIRSLRGLHIPSPSFEMARADWARRSDYAANGCAGHLIGVLDQREAATRGRRTQNLLRIEGRVLADEADLDDAPAEVQGLSRGLKGRRDAAATGGTRRWP